MYLRASSPLLTDMTLLGSLPLLPPVGTSTPAVLVSSCLAQPTTSSGLALWTSTLCTVHSFAFSQNSGRPLCWFLEHFVCMSPLELVFSISPPWTFWLLHPPRILVLVSSIQPDCRAQLGTPFLLCRLHSAAGGRPGGPRGSRHSFCFCQGSQYCAARVLCFNRFSRSVSRVSGCQLLCPEQKQESH